MFSKLNSLIDAISKEKNVKKSVIIQAMEGAFISIVRKKLGELGSIANLEAMYVPEEDEVTVYQYKVVVSDTEDDGQPKVLTNMEQMTQILLKDAKQSDPEAEVGDEIGFLIDGSLKELNRKNVQIFRQILMQKITDAERKTLMDTFIDKKGKIVSGIVKTVDAKGNALVDLGSAEAVLNKRDMLETDSFSKNSRVSALLVDVTRSGGRTPTIILSRNSHMFLVKKMEDECSKLEEGIIEIVKVAREGGLRSKVVVKSNDSTVNALSELLGDNGYRIQAISESLDGEKINIIPFTKDRSELLVNCLKPGKIESFTEKDEVIDVVVEAEELGKIIGKKGSNLRVAASIMGKRINVITTENLSKMKTLAREELSVLTTVGPLGVEKLITKELYSLKKIASSDVLLLQDTLQVTKEEAESVVKEAKKIVSDSSFNPVTEQVSLVESYGIPKEFPLPEKQVGSTVSAERRLREELAAFKLK